jgi:predicted NBD/HSP70 family sugar kinase
VKKTKGGSALNRRVKAKGGTIHFLPSPDLNERIAKGDPPGDAEIDEVARSVSDALERHEQGKGRSIRRL